MHQNIIAINLVADRNAKEKEERRRVVAARINEQIRRRKQAAQVAETQARQEAQEELKKEIKARFLQAPYATELDFNEAWKRDKLSMIREYEHSWHFSVGRM